MKIIRYVSLILCVLYMLGSVAVSADATSLGQESLPPQHNEASVSGSHGIDAAMTLLGTEPVIENVKSAFVYEVKSETLMYAANADEKMYPSSLVKIMTAYIAAETGNPDDVITVREDVLATVPYDAVSAKLQPNEIITLRDLLYCMMVGSANDAAAVIADHISGTQEAFVDKMNEYAQTLGCTQTNFTNVHGLHDDAQYTTVRDMTRILCAAINNEDFVTYFGATQYTVESTNTSDARHLSSGNYLTNLQNSDDIQIYHDIRATGGRTGVTGDGRRCLATMAENDGMQIIAVLMGAEDVFADDGRTVRIYGGYKETTTLLDAAFDGFDTVQVLFPNQAIQQNRVLNGESDVVLGVKEEAFAVLPEGISIANLNYRYINSGELSAPINKGDQIACVQVWHGNMCVAQADLFAMNSVSESITVIAPNKPEASGKTLKTFLIVIVIMIVFAVLVVFSIRYFSVLRHKMRQRRYRNARRRSR